MVDTVCALSTAPGRGGVAVIRLSGPQALRCARALFPFPQEPKARYMYYGKMSHGAQALDDGMAVWFPAPHSYTGEEMVELHCHGGSTIARSVLDALMAAGARPAMPGEFTQRAFLHGKMDLSQAEAVQQLIDAASQRSAGAALRQLRGSVFHKIKDALQELTYIYAALEAGIEYPEEDIPEAQPQALAPRLLALAEEMEELADSYARGRILRDGLTVALVGKPNTGKSSLLNRLTGEESSIVTPIPGTTRDVVKERILIGSLCCQLLDTAGVRDSLDPIEQEGVRRSQAAAEKADITLMVVDSSQPLSPEEEELWAALPPDRRLAVYNKQDLAPGVPTLTPRVCLSALTGEGMKDLVAALEDLAEQLAPEGEGVLLTSARQQDACDRAARSLRDSVGALDLPGGLELCAIDLADARLRIGRDHRRNCGGRRDPCHF